MLCAMQLSQWFPRKNPRLPRLGPVFAARKIVSVFLAYTKQKFGMPGIMPYQPTSCPLDKILIEEYASLVRSQFHTQFGTEAQKCKTQTSVAMKANILKSVHETLNW